MLLFYGVLKVLKVLKVLFCNNKTGPPSQASRSYYGKQNFPYYRGGLTAKLQKKFVHRQICVSTKK